jgi:chitosanase
VGVLARFIISFPRAKTSVIQNNPDGQPDTSFGNLDAGKVPFYVLPLSFHNAQSSVIKPNALGAIVCNGKMFYGIFGDEE